MKSWPKVKLGRSWESVRTLLKITRLAYRKLYLAIIGPNSHGKLLPKYKIRQIIICSNLVLSTLIFPQIGPYISYSMYYSIETAPLCQILDQSLFCLNYPHWTIFVLIYPDFPYWTRLRKASLFGYVYPNLAIFNPYQSIFSQINPYLEHLSKLDYICPPPPQPANVSSAHPISSTPSSTFIFYLSDLFCCIHQSRLFLFKIYKAIHHKTYHIESLN